MEPSRKRPVDTLTYTNWENWFSLFELWAQGEGIDFVLRKTATQYAYTSTIPGVSTQSTNLSPTPNSSGLPTPQPTDRSLEVLDLLESLQIVEKTPLEGHWDEARLQRWIRAQAKVRYTMAICVEEIDNLMLKEHKTVKAGWEALQAKYSTTR